LWQLGDQEQKRLKSLASRLAPDPAEARRPAAGGEHGSTVSELAALDALMSERIVVLDGAWGTMIQARGLAPEDYRGTRFADHERDVAGDPDVLNLTRPDVVSQIHRAYLAAGADVTTTNTFTATRIGQADYGLGAAVHEMNVAGARLAREACDEAATPERPRFAAGSVGPLNVTLSMSARVEDPAHRAATFDEVCEGYAEQMRGLAEGGVDLLLIETVFDTLNAKAAIVAAQDVAPELPIVISMTVVDRSGRTLSGQTVEAFWASIEHARPLAVAINCSLGGAEMRPWLAELARVASAPVRLRRDPGGDHRAAARVRRERSRQRRRRLLRHDAGAHRRDRRGRGRAASQGRAWPLAAAALRRAGAVHGRGRDGLRDGRRAHERDRVGALPPADRGR
jgi:5-methyltetrahydrofolate--homocysteine methyltransferase